jgi:hypothetical protein
MLAANGTTNTGLVILYILFALAVYGAMAYGGAKLMELSGHSPVAGALLGFFCGVIGLLICLAFFLSDPDRRRNTPRQAQPLYPPDPYGYGYQQPQPYPPPYQQPYQQPYPPVAAPLPPGVVPPAPPESGLQASARCPQCSAPVYPGTEFCNNCGAYVQDQAQAPQSQRAPQSFKICPLCHGKATAESESCPQCGSDLKDTPAW